jgi:hypothetical protein
MACAHASGTAELALRERRFGCSEDLLEPVLRRGLGLVRGLSAILLDNAESERRGIGAESELQPVDSGRGAVLDGEVEALAQPAQIEVGISPGMQLRGPAQRSSLRIGTVMTWTSRVSKPMAAAWAMPWRR